MFVNAQFQIDNNRNPRQSWDELNLPKHHCCAYNCTNNLAKRKGNQTNAARLHFFPFSDERNNFAPEMNEQGRHRKCMDRSTLAGKPKVTRPSLLCSKNIEEGLGQQRATLFLQYFIFVNISSERKWNDERSRGETIEELFHINQNSCRRQANLAN